MVLKNESKERYYSPEMLDDLKDRLSEQIDSLFKKNPLSGGIKSVEIKEQLALPNKVFEHIVGQLISENKIAKSDDLISRVEKRIHGPSCIDRSRSPASGSSCSK